MFLLGSVLCEVHVMKTWNTPSTKGDSAQYSFNKNAIGRSAWMLAFKLRTRRGFQ